MFKELDAIVLTSEIPLDHIWDVPPGSPLVENGNLRKGDCKPVTLAQLCICRVARCSRTAVQVRVSASGEVVQRSPCALLPV